MDGWLEKENGNDEQDPVQLVVGDVARGPEIDGIDDLVVAIIFVAIDILRLPSMAWCMSY